jgi:hypothetical protein
MQISMGALMNVDIITSAAEGRRDDKEKFTCTVYSVAYSHSEVCHRHCLIGRDITTRLVLSERNGRKKCASPPNSVLDVRIFFVSKYPYIEWEN